MATCHFWPNSPTLIVVGVEDNDVGDVTRLVLLCRGSETFPGDMLGFKVTSAAETLIGVEDTVTVKEVCVCTEEPMVPGTEEISEVDVTLVAVSEIDQKHKWPCVHICINTHTHTSQFTLLNEDLIDNDTGNNLTQKGELGELRVT